MSILFRKGDGVVLRVSCLAELELRKFLDSVIDDDDDVDDRNWELKRRRRKGNNELGLKLENWWLLEPINPIWTPTKFNRHENRIGDKAGFSWTKVKGHCEFLNKKLFLYLQLMPRIHSSYDLLRKLIWGQLFLFVSSRRKHCSSYGINFMSFLWLCSVHMTRRLT